MDRIEEADLQGMACRAAGEEYGNSSKLPLPELSLALNAFAAAYYSAVRYCEKPRFRFLGSKVRPLNALERISLSNKCATEYMERICPGIGPEDYALVHGAAKSGFRKGAELFEIRFMTHAHAG